MLRLANEFVTIILVNRKIGERRLTTGCNQKCESIKAGSDGEVVVMREGVMLDKSLRII